MTGDNTLKDQARSDEALVRAARDAREQAYAPYSGYKVGAAVRCKDGRVFSGANVESASYGLTCCAERVAIFKAVSEGCRRFDAVAVVTGGAKPAAPCGACRQVIVEFSPDARIIMENLEGERAEAKARDYLPDAFVPAALQPRGTEPF
jgi:cytidine deaminase